MLETSQIADILNGLFNLIATIIFFAIIIMAKTFRRDRSDVSFLLTLNSSFASFFTCLVMSFMLISTFSSGFLTFDMEFCYIFGLFYDICQCAIYHSYLLQALFRLFRVVFYHKRVLLNYSLYQVLILVQWTISIAFSFPPFFLNWYSNLLTEHYCLITYTPIDAPLYQTIILYLIPLACITLIYAWISLYIRRSNFTTAQMLTRNQNRRNARDLVMIKRIILMITVLVLMRCPTLIFIIYTMILGHVHPVAFPVSGSIMSLCLILIGFITIHFTPKFQDNISLYLCCRPHPLVIGQPVRRMAVGNIADMTRQIQDPLKKTPAHETPARLSRTV